MTPRPRVEIVVDELVVRGLPPEAARTAAAALETRLTALAERGGAPIAGRAEAFRRLPAVEAPAGSPAAVGEAVAGAVWGALSPGGAR
ncbi:MAG TPA: hypothetical protein VGJ25_11525 [Gaiellaceae bacterium]|jgi:hypothetical protein